jgi:hypothetical protein
MNKIISVAAALATLVASSAMAAEGAYNLVSLGVSPLTDQSGTTYGFGVSIGGGYGFNKYFGVEAQLAVLGIGTGNNVSVMPIPSLTVNGYIPVREGISLYGKIGKSETIVGYGAAGTQASYSGVSNFYGAGFEFLSSGSKDTYRIGVDHYDLGVVPGSPLAANYINLGATTHF